MLELIKGKDKYDKVYNYLQKLSKKNWSFGIKEHSNVCYLVKEVDDVSYVMHILIGDDLSIADSNILYWISINSVNEILRSFFLQHTIPFTDIIYTGVDLVTVNNIPEWEKYQPWLDSTKPEYKIGSKQSFEKIENFITNNALPFFEQIKTVEDVNEKIINVVDWMRWADYIPGQTIMKAMIIMHLGKNTMYENFTNEYLKRIKDAIDSGMSKYQDYYDKINALKNYLSDSF